MNATNRAANRLFVLIVGLVLVALGAFAILLGTGSALTSGWGAAARSARRGLDDAFTATTIAGTRADWIGVAVLVLLAVLVVLLVTFIARQGGGHTPVLLERGGSAGTGSRGRAGTNGPDSDGADDGLLDGDRIVIDTAVARDLLADALSAHPELVASSVSTYRVHRSPTLKIAATCRRGVAPTEAQALIETALRRLDRVVGHEVPALIELTGGFRARVAAATTRVD